MHLRQTQTFMRQMEAKDFLDSYAILVRKGKDSALITSDNTDRDTFFDIASLGKILVTTPLVLKAVGEGRLSLDDTLDKYFDDVPEDKTNISIRQMLTHTSGLHEDAIPKMTCDRGSEAIAGHILSEDLDFTPGTKYQYSSSGMILSGFILAKVYHMPLDGVFYSRLAMPLDLRRSRFNIDIEEKNAAVCYYRESPGANCAADRNVYVMKNCVAGSGGEFESVGDIQKFAEAVMAKDERLYPKYLFDLAEQDYTPDFEIGRGLGYYMVDKRYTEIGDLFPAGSFGHIGNTGTLFFFNRQMDLYVIILTNATHFAYKRHNYAYYCDSEITGLRAQINNSIKADLEEQGLL